MDNLDSSSPILKEAFFFLRAECLLGKKIRCTNLKRKRKEKKNKQGIKMESQARNWEIENSSSCFWPEARRGKSKAGPSV